VVEIRSGETMIVEIDGRREVVHLACIDTPEMVHGFPELDFYGRQALGEAVLLAGVGRALCIADEKPPRVDREGHRIVYAALADGRDLGGELIGRGLALARSGACSRAADYRELESKALVAERGSWGHSDNDPSLALAVGGARGGPRTRPPRGGGSS